MRIFPPKLRGIVENDVLIGDFQPHGMGGSTMDDDGVIAGPAQGYAHAAAGIGFRVKSSQRRLWKYPMAARSVQQAIRGRAEGDNEMILRVKRIHTGRILLQQQMGCQSFTTQIAAQKAWKS